MSTPDQSTAERELRTVQAYADLFRSIAAIRQGLAALERTAQAYGADGLYVRAGEVAVLSRDLSALASKLDVLNESMASAVAEEVTR